MDILAGSGDITLQEAAEIRKLARSKNISIEEELLERGLDEQKILKAKGEALGIPTFSLAGKKISFDLLKNIPEESARHYQFVPINLENGTISIGMVDPDNIEAKEALKFIATRINQPFKIFVISRRDLTAILGEYKGISGEVTKVLGELEVALSEEPTLPKELERTETSFVEDAPITKMVAVILRHATEGRASDIHIEPSRDKLRVRFRVDGILYTSLFLPMKVHDSIISRIKILTNMQLDEKRKPQDGRFSAKIEGREIDFRVSTFPTYFGEKVAIRILDPETGIKNLDDVGFSPGHARAVKEALTRPYGLILLTGPTGSGKTTTLYAMLQSLNEDRWNIVSLEDPVEYSIGGVNQSQVRPEIGYDFAEGLHHILRQDPDVIMVGEIRDKETAQLAIHAALTGHLVLSTLHTNTAIGVIPRLIDMGVDPYLIAPTLIMAIGQRLVRTLCDDSKEEVPVEGKIKEIIMQEINAIPENIKRNIKIPKVIYKPKISGTCPKGSRGRIAIFEILEVTKSLEKLILEKPSEAVVEEEAKKQGMLTLRQDGVLRALEGRVGLEELLEVI
ncbi:MAG: Type IV pilus assembly protein PilB [Candidatus Giovannonibacteria bacterium GW2011_GWC2_44_9]|uniref:Type IV pilus assembly protein PilB n=3 Tax=Candidatus Giovannoniibacteriota TaxID=1752738 RepID=A0A0G1LWQ3_9BACT|nr:MAG: Type IV pilus assembly protein PilB [Candidatus Giovannonibacteria bacterium GW2011_GWB1_44_23]KKT64144.1 MAG: Type IV pilus assembly protein PilB [Candidatus Giovannonibacteria bacterium GW2011_GWA1_44_29]KKT84402.1 MAG: Type IV pilus assembly protein PilB [Candidatus Giovannonibacteria bacterium GW2011_GWC2_44_9]KKT91744.1 MAG: Type IV pilus assembly protein PilB [Parcubacteria group bacterium GW2011_GWC1_45_13]